jgi:hypothetical protein
MWFQGYPTLNDFERVEKSVFWDENTCNFFLAYYTLGYYADMYFVHPGSILL